MMLAVILAALLTIPVLGVVTFVQVLYLESLRLRTRDLPSLKFFKDTVEDRIGLKTEQGAGAFSLIKHSLLVWLTILFFAWFADGKPWTARVLWQTGVAVWLTMPRQSSVPSRGLIRYPITGLPEPHRAIMSARKSKRRRKQSAWVWKRYSERQSACATSSATATGSLACR